MRLVRSVQYRVAFIIGSIASPFAEGIMDSLFGEPG